MNKNFKLTHFFVLLIVKYFYLFIPGLLFLFLGKKVSSLIIIGIVLLLIDIFLALLGCIKLENTLNNLNEEELKNAFECDDFTNEVVEALKNKYEEQLKEMEDEENNYSIMYWNLSKNLNEEMNFLEIISLFKTTCLSFKTKEDSFYAVLKSDFYDELPSLSLLLSYRFHTINEIKELNLKFIFDKKYFDNIFYFEYQDSDENKFFDSINEEIFIKQVIEKNINCIKIYVTEEVVL